jgi:hypothetical protein
MTRKCIESPCNSSSQFSLLLVLSQLLGRLTQRRIPNRKLSIIELQKYFDSRGSYTIPRFLDQKLHKFLRRPLYWLRFVSLLLCQEFRELITEVADSARGMAHLCHTKSHVAGVMEPADIFLSSRHNTTDFIAFALIMVMYSSPFVRHSFRRKVLKDPIEIEILHWLRD